MRYIKASIAGNTQGAYRSGAIAKIGNADVADWGFKRCVDELIGVPLNKTFWVIQKQAADQPS